MSFFKKLMDHMFNQVLVETLANSRWFQRFAVYSHKMSKEVTEKGEPSRPPRLPCKDTSSCVGAACLHSPAIVPPDPTLLPSSPTLLLSVQSAPPGKDTSKVLDEHIGTLASKAKDTAAQVGAGWMGGPRGAAVAAELAWRLPPSCVVLWLPASYPNRLQPQSSTDPEGVHG
jgi:hypothetical protein